MKIVSHNGLDTEVYDLRPADYTTTTTTTTECDDRTISMSIWSGFVPTRPTSDLSRLKLIGGISRVYADSRFCRTARDTIFTYRVCAS